MKDLKHLYTLEKLLESAHNELVQQAVDEGKHALGYTCYHMPEVLLNADNCFSVRLRAPRTGSMDISGYYMNNFICDYCKSLLERGIEGGYHFLSAIMGTETCSEMNRALEHFDVMPIVDHEGFFVSFLDMPFKTTEAAVQHYVTQLQVKVLDRMHESFGTDVSDAALRKAVEEHNEVCRLITEIGEYRKEDNPRITGYEFAVLNVASYACPKALILPYLRDTAEELKTRKPDAKPRMAREDRDRGQRDRRPRLHPARGGRGRARGGGPLLLRLHAGQRGDRAHGRYARAGADRAALSHDEPVPALHGKAQGRRAAHVRAAARGGLPRAGRAV